MSFLPVASEDSQTEMEAMDQVQRCRGGVAEDSCAPGIHIVLYMVNKSIDHAALDKGKKTRTLVL